jgi:hypothetical protein
VPLQIGCTCQLPCNADQGWIRQNLVHIWADEIAAGAAGVCWPTSVLPAGQQPTLKREVPAAAPIMPRPRLWPLRQQAVIRPAGDCALLPRPEHTPHTRNESRLCAPLDDGEAVRAVLCHLSRAGPAALAAFNTTCCADAAVASAHGTPQSLHTRHRLYTGGSGFRVLSARRGPTARAHTAAYTARRIVCTARAPPPPRRAAAAAPPPPPHRIAHNARRRTTLAINTSQRTAAQIGLLLPWRRASALGWRICSCEISPGDSTASQTSDRSAQSRFCAGSTRLGCEALGLHATNTLDATIPSS